MNVFANTSNKPVVPPSLTPQAKPCCGGLLRTWYVWVVVAALAAFGAWDLGWGPPPTGTLQTNSIGMELVYIAPGAFVMGSPGESVARDQKPQATPHKVTITRGFYIGRAEVTQTQWQAVMGEKNNPSAVVGDDLPVQNVTWGDAIEFCKRLSAMEGKVYRLPTEAQWEYVSRAGTMGRDVLGARGKLQPAGTRRGNAWGACDMLGSVAEWCLDKYEPYAPGSAVDPVVKSDEPNVPRVRRGGSFSGPLGECSSSARASSPGESKAETIGFRVVRERLASPHGRPPWGPHPR